MYFFVALMAEIFKFLQLPISMYGFTFSFFDIMIWSVIAGLICWLLGVVLS